MNGLGGPAGPQRATASIPIRPLGRVVAITSGTGGVGKTFVAANLAAALARRGQRVLLLDAYLGLSNLDIGLKVGFELLAGRIHADSHQTAVGAVRIK